MSALNSFADLDLAFRKIHENPNIDRKRPYRMPSEFADLDNSEDINGSDAHDLGASMAKMHDPTALDWEENPIDFKTFCEHKEHMDLLPSDWKEGDEGALSDKQYKDCMALLGEDPKLMFDPDTREYLFAGFLWAKGSGKDYICSIIQAYVVYIMLCLKNPQDYFGFAPGEACDILNVGKKGKQAEKVYFTKFRARILNWKWMLNKYNVIDEGKRHHFNSKDHPTCKLGTRSAEWLNKGVRAFSENSASPESFEGYNIIFYLCDEISGWVSESERKVAEHILSVLRSSQGSRSTKKLRGLGMAISFPRQDDDIMFSIEKEAATEGSRVYFSRGFQQEIKPKRFYSGKTFQFNAGTDDRPEFFDVPIELDENFFKKHPSKAKGMYLLRPPTVTDQFFDFTDKIDMISHSDRVPLFKIEADYTNSIDGHGNKVLYVRKNVVGINREPLRDVDYVGWIDIGDVTCDAALTIGHLELVNMIEGGNQFETRVVVADQTIVWEPDKKLQKIVDVSSITNCCITMLKYINLKVVWYDHWNSSVGVKDLRDHRILCDRHNLTGDEYTHFKDIIYANRFIAPECPQTNKGIEQVKHLSGTKTGNVKPGSGLYKKDISDTWCGIVSLLLGKLAKTTFRAGTAPTSITIVSGGKNRPGVSTAGVAQGVSNNNPFSGSVNQMGAQLIRNHGDMFRGLNPAVNGRSHNIGRGSKKARPTAQDQARSRFPRGISL